MKPIHYSQANRKCLGFSFCQIGLTLSVGADYGTLSVELDKQCLTVPRLPEPW